MVGVDIGRRGQPIAYFGQIIREEGNKAGVRWFIIFLPPPNPLHAGPQF